MAQHYRDHAAVAHAGSLEARDAVLAANVTIGSATRAHRIAMGRGPAIEVPSPVTPHPSWGEATRLAVPTAQTAEVISSPSQTAEAAASPTQTADAMPQSVPLSHEHRATLLGTFSRLSDSLQRAERHIYEMEGRNMQLRLEMDAIAATNLQLNHRTRSKERVR